MPLNIVFYNFEKVSRYVSYRDPSIAIRIVSSGYRIVTPLHIRYLLSSTCAKMDVFGVGLTIRLGTQL